MRSEILQCRAVVSENDLPVPKSVRGSLNRSINCVPQSALSIFKGSGVSTPKSAYRRRNPSGFLFNSKHSLGSDSLLFLLHLAVVSLGTNGWDLVIWNRFLFYLIVSEGQRLEDIRVGSTWLERRSILPIDRFSSSNSISNVWCSKHYDYPSSLRVEKNPAWLQEAMNFVVQVANYIKASALINCLLLQSLMGHGCDSTKPILKQPSPPAFNPEQRLRQDLWATATMKFFSMIKVAGGLKAWRAMVFLTISRKSGTLPSWSAKVANNSPEIVPLHFPGN